jgi:histidinol-phosphate aminotransferase
MPVKPTAIIGALRAYDPGHDLPAMRLMPASQPLVELGSNENSLGPSPLVLQRLAAAPAEEVFRYPDPCSNRLRQALARQLSVAADRILVGNGSHELLMLIAQTFAGPGDEVVFSEFGFAVFPIGTAAVGATPCRVPALPVVHAMPRGHDLDAMLAAITPRTRIVFVANPNNPTGTWVTRAALRRFLGAVPADVLVVLDEAYHEYVDRDDVASGVEFLAEHANLLVTRTFSKGYGLAGLRLGYAIGHVDTVAALNRLRESFNANALALLAAEAALQDPAHLARVRDLARSERDRVGARLRAAGYLVHPSLTNFLLVDFGEPASPLEQRLMQQQVVVRPMGGYGLPTCLRVTVATPAENDRFLAALAV